MSTLFKPDNQVWNTIRASSVITLSANEVCKLFWNLTTEQKAEIVVQLLSDDEELEQLVKEWVNHDEAECALVIDVANLIERAESGLTPDLVD